MWMTIIVMCVSFLLTKLSGGSDKKALGVAAIAGAGTYLAVNNTDWGADLSNSVDDMLGVTNKPDAKPGSGPTPGRTVTGYDSDGKPIYGSTGNGSSAGGTSSGLGGLLSSIWAGLGGAGQAIVGGGAAIAATSFLSKYGAWIVAGVGAYFLFKD